MIKFAFGCSHTAGVGVELHEAFPNLLNATNYGVEGISANFLARHLIEKVQEQKPDVIYILWPDWSRFEYIDNDGNTQQSLPTDTNRIHFMETATDDWLKSNFKKVVDSVHTYCVDNKITLIDATLYDLIPFINHADKWPVSKLGHHYSEIWHQWVADIFNNALQNNTRFPLNNE